MLTNKVLIVLAVAAQILIFSTDTDAACLVPLELQDKDWEYKYTDVSTGETMTKTLSFGSTTIEQGISLHVEGSELNSWTCLSDLTISDTESIAVFKSNTFDMFPDFGRRLYLCMRFTKVTDNLFYFHLMSDKNGLVTPKERVFSPPLPEPDANADVCSTFCSYGEPKPMIRTLRKLDTTDTLPVDADLCENCGDSCIASDKLQSIQSSITLVDCIITGNEVPFAEVPAIRSYGYMESITYDCITGYEIQSGNVVRFCDADGTWSGETPVCDIVTDECATEPCVNGQCFDGVASYTCSCDTGYDGTNCDQNVDDCDPNPCLNDGECSDQLNSYTCKCASGYQGQKCDIDTDDCAPTPCLNGGECLDGVNSFTCSCAAGYEGDTCSQILCTVSGMVPFATGPTDGSYNHMDNIIYSCNRGYEVQSGNLERSCQADGTWSGSTPVCVEVKCQDPENGQFTEEQTSSGYSFPDTVTYSCIFGYEVQSGDLERSCQADGTWSGNAPVCKMTVDYFCEALLETLESKGKSKERSAESPDESSEIDTRGKGKANGKWKGNWRKGRRCGYYKALEALIAETCLLS